MSWVNILWLQGTYLKSLSDKKYLPSLMIGKARLHIRQLIIVVLMLLALVSQALASAIVPCAMNMTAAMPTPIVMSNALTPSIKVAASVADSGVTVQAYCHENESQMSAEAQCHCELGSCVSAALNMALPVLISLSQGVQPTFILPSQVKPQYRASLYRPPISII
ncbi:hypothetical protein [Shewanella surugensis]|uniref:DUF2946 domain-containing protein n=1 Tax=Shewanella surugensis TaxID=212020 RepID=A0ABT0L9C3_9GAMM|nr:hypothetical protein [Shewanella surugensis]MCL1124298.1 hypothetical protein [Shewanella surugensis]